MTKTIDIRVSSEISVLETNRSTQDYKILVLHGKGNKSAQLVYLPYIANTNDTLVYIENICYTNFSEAVESLWLKMFDAQDKLDERVNIVSSMINYVLGEN